MGGDERLVEQLKLAFDFKSLSPFAEALRRGALPYLRQLHIRSSTLRELPEEIGMLGLLEELLCRMCSTRSTA